MFSFKFLAVSLAIASHVRAALPIGPKDLVNSTNSSAPAMPPVGSTTNTSLPTSPSSSTNGSLPTSPIGSPTKYSTPGGQVPGDTSTGQCLCPAIPTCPAPASPASPVGNTPSSPVPGAPVNNSGGIVSPGGSTPSTNDSTPGNTTSSAVTNSVSLLSLLTAGALAIAV